MTAPAMLRPSVAARRFGVSQRTLSRWSAAGLIGRSQVGHCVLYDAGDIADMIARHTTARTVVPGMLVVLESGTDDWQDDDFWKGAAQ